MHWAETVLTALKEQQVRLMVYVPDNVLIPLISGAQADPHWTAFTTTREEEAIGIACGADMGGMRAVVWTEIVQASVYLIGGIAAVILIGHLTPGGGSTVTARQIP